MNTRFSHDLERAGRTTVGGADEAGRGCLAGPLVAASVVFDYADWNNAAFAELEDLNDSKKLTRPTRARLYEAVLARAAQVAVVACSPGTIDARGLHVCNLDALRRTLALLEPAPRVAFVDGFPLGGDAVPHEALVGGDGRSAAVAAASVVAKVTRDRLMMAAHERWPLYGFDSHVGYACEAHRDAIVEHGVCEIHRMSFNSVAYQQLDLSLLLEEDVAG